MKKAPHDPFLYTQIAESIESQIQNDVLKVGDKLPSLRTICKEFGVSQSTAIQAYLQLEKKALISSKPKSGYFVCFSVHKFPPLPHSSKPFILGNNNDVDVLIQSVYNRVLGDDVVNLSQSIPSQEILPIAKLNKGIINAMRVIKGGGTEYDLIQGNESLRRQIARHAYAMQAKIKPDDIISTAGCSNALLFSLISVTKRGDTIAVESPVFFGILQLAKSLGLTIIEVPTNPQTGIEMDAFKQLLKKGKIQACILISNFSNPIGSCMPDENKKEVVTLAERYGVSIIEDDLYGDIYFGSERPKSCKTYDESGNVLWCSSISKTLAPGYRVGWVAPGIYKEKILQLKLNHSMSSTTLTHQVIAHFLESGRYENHLMKLRQTLQANLFQYLKAIGKYFPPGTSVSRPQGGLVLWVEFPKNISTTELYKKALKNKINIAPGKMFTLKNQFENCMRLSYGLIWNDKVEHALETLGRLSVLV
ncbi:MAG: transcriptional regulator, GntR family with aminotransferase domain [Flaviaesturariibacter sp.]|nr:transcriptional regulator, GntR family with aminotransferase domain [Flaviaesturariibacter sp.]